ncbi:MAG TPA: hypothetical protein VGK74_06830 [Symbiobacteriaceae bacterium]|jgi:hypothetical protein
MKPAGEDEVRQAVLATGQEILDEVGNSLGYVAQPACFKISRPYLARGGFLVVTRDQESGAFRGIEFDALPHPKTKGLYPAGHSEQGWTAGSLQEAVSLVMAYLHALDVE